MEYSIGEVARLVDASCQTLRNLENNGLITKPRRSATNRRRYSDADVKAIRQFLAKKKTQ